MATTVKGTDGKTYTLGSAEYTKYLLGTTPGVAATTGTQTDTKTGKTTKQPTTVKAADGKTYTLGSQAYTDYLIGAAQKLGVPVKSVSASTGVPEGAPTPASRITGEAQPQYSPSTGVGTMSPGGQWKFNGSTWVATQAVTTTAMTTTPTAPTVSTPPLPGTNYAGTTPTTGPTAPAVSSTSPTSIMVQKILETIQKQGQGIVSSSETDFKKQIAAITNTLQDGRDEAKVGINAAADRAVIEAKEKGQETLTSAAEALRFAGPASTFALLDRIQTSIDKSVRDLELRRQEALATGSMEVASKIADLQMKAIEFNQKARQDSFQNLLATGTFALNVQESEAKAQADKVKQATDTLDLFSKYNLLSNMSSQDKAYYEQTLGLPAGSLNKVVTRAEEKYIGSETDDYGNTTALFQNTTTNAIRKENLGAIGKTNTTGTNTEVSNSLDLYGNWFGQVLSTDGAVTSADYSSAQADFAANYGKSLADPVKVFQAAFPPAQTISDPVEARRYKYQ